MGRECITFKWSFNDTVKFLDFQVDSIKSPTKWCLDELSSSY